MRRGTRRLRGVRVTAATEERGVVGGDGTDLPVPGLEPRGVTLEEFMRLMPPTLGFIGDGTPEDPDEARSQRQVLALLLVNTGLADAVRLAPRQTWLEALEATYGPPR